MGSSARLGWRLITGGPRAWRAWFDEAGRDLRTLQTRKSVVSQADVLIQVVDRLAPRPPLLNDESEQELLAYSRRLIDLAARGLAAELGVAAAAAASYGRLDLMLSRHLGADEGPRAAQLVTAAGVSAERRASASAAVFAGPTWLERGTEPPRLTNPAHPANPDDPTSPNDPNEERRHQQRLLEARIKAIPGWTRRRILTGQIVDVRLHLIRRTIGEVVEQLHRREEAKAAVLELGGEVRRVHLELGRRLVAAGLLDDPLDIELLSSREIVDLVPVGPSGSPPTPSAAAATGSPATSRRGCCRPASVGSPTASPNPSPKATSSKGGGPAPAATRVGPGC